MTKVRQQKLSHWTKTIGSTQIKFTQTSVATSLFFTRQLAAHIYNAKRTTAIRYRHNCYPYCTIGRKKNYIDKLLCGGLSERQACGRETCLYATGNAERRWRLSSSGGTVFKQNGAFFFLFKFRTEQSQVFFTLRSPVLWLQTNKKIILQTNGIPLSTPSRPTSYFQLLTFQAIFSPLEFIIPLETSLCHVNQL